MNKGEKERKHEQISAKCIRMMQVAGLLKNAECRTCMNRHKRRRGKGFILRDSTAVNDSLSDLAGQCEDE